MRSIRSRSTTRRTGPLGAAALTLLATLLAVAASALAPAAADPPTPVYGVGDVFLGVNGSTSLHEFSPAGAPVRQIPLPDRYAAASVFDQQGDLLVATFFGPIDEFDPQGNFVGVFADLSTDGLPGGPQSMTVDAAGHVFVSAFSYNYGTEVADVIREYDASGTLVDHFRVRTTDHSVDAVDLAADQCTLYYVSGDLLLTYDTCTRTQGRPLTRSLSNGATGIRVLPDGELLLAAYNDVQLLSADGRLVGAYHPPPVYTGNFDQVALAPDGTSFWTIDSLHGLVFRIRLSDGRLLRRFHVDSRASGSGDSVIGALTVFGEPTAARS